MWSSREYLARCAELQRAGFAPQFKAGRRVARGFADLGYEEFCLLSENRTVSLFNGKVSDLPEDHRHFFFAVPECDEMIDELDRRGFDIEGTSFEGRRTWVLRMQPAKGGEAIEARGGSMEEVLVEALLIAVKRG